MSFTEKHIGRLVEVDFNRNRTTPEHFYKMLCEYHDYSSLTVTKYRGSYTYKSWEELYWKELCDEGNLYRVDGKVYKLVDHVKLEDDMSLFNKNPDGSISFAVEFYNGATCLREVLEDGIKRICKTETSNKENIELDNSEFDYGHNVSYKEYYGG